MPWGRAPTVINVGSGTPQDMGSLAAALQELREAIDRQTEAILETNRRVDLVDSSVRGVEIRMDALYPVLDRLERRPGGARGRPTGRVGAREALRDLGAEPAA